MDLNIVAMLWGWVPIALIAGGIITTVGVDMKAVDKKGETVKVALTSSGLALLTSAAASFILALGLTF